jgi:phosphatidylinositol glycan class X
MAILIQKGCNIRVTAIINSFFVAADAVNTRFSDIQMEIQYLHLSIFARLGILLLVRVGICFDSSMAFEVGDKYITFPYFLEHDRLVDLNFQNFLDYNLFSLGSCDVLRDERNLVPNLSVDQRHLIGEGSHRRLSSSIRFKNPYKSISILPAHFCEAIIIERLPAGVFADPFELYHLIERGSYCDAAAFGDTNLELPTVKSDRSVVEIHMDIGANAFSLQNDDFVDVNFEIPLHSRYPPLGEVGYSRIEFGPPDLYTRCWMEGNLQNRSCLIKSSGKNIEMEGNLVIWEVPSGRKEHQKIVSFVTFASATFSCLLLVFVSVYTSNNVEYSGTKQS